MRGWDSRLGAAAGIRKNSHGPLTLAWAMRYTSGRLRKADCGGEMRGGGYRLGTNLFNTFSTPGETLSRISDFHRRWGTVRLVPEIPRS